MRNDILKYLTLLTLIVFTVTANAFQDEKIIVFIEEDLYDSIEFEVNRYVDDISSYYTVELYEISGGNADDLKSSIISLYSDSLIGCVLIGALPYRYFEIKLSDGRYSNFPCDLYIMDLDGSWSDEDQDYIYDTHVNGQGDVNPEIFIARIDASRFIDEINLLRNYFNKNHNYYSGNITFIKKALTYTDDDWQMNYNINHDIQNLYGRSNYTNINNTSVTKNDYLVNRLKNDQYEFIQLACHSGSSYHSFSRGGSLYGTDIQDAPPQALGYNLFACSACDYTFSDFLCGSYIFNDGNKPLVVVGSTKAGSMLCFHAFYEPLNNNKPVGKAFKEWFDYIAPFTESERWWHYGMTIIGDPLVRFHSLYETPDPPVVESIAVFEGDPVPDLVASGENIKWYDDMELTNLIQTGNTFSTGQTEIGTYIYYATQTRYELESHSVTVTLTIIPKDPPLAMDVTICEGQQIPDLSAIGENLKWYNSLDNPPLDLYDIRDQQIYKTVIIGDQIWMAENLNYYTPDGSWYYSNDSINYSEIYGRLYNWETAQDACPSGWFLPDTADWQNLIDYLGSNEIAGGKLKETGTSHWDFPNVDATNETGFTALPAGKRDVNGTYHHLGNYSKFWNSTYENWDFAHTIEIRHDSSGIFHDIVLKSTGFSIRCIRDINAPIEAVSTHHPDYTDVGSYTYYVTQTISGLESPPDTVTFTINSVPSEPLTSDISVCEDDTMQELTATGDNIKWYGDTSNYITDPRDSQVYKTITIGGQTWMAENLNYDTSSGSWYYENDSSQYSETYGRLYNWETALNVCPSGWHLPGDSEWIDLEIYLGMNYEEAQSNGMRGNYEGGMLKESGYTHWDYPNIFATNQTGFDALPGGESITLRQLYDGMGHMGFFWTSTENEFYKAFARKISNYHGSIYRSDDEKELAYSVRCIKDNPDIIGSGNNLFTHHAIPGNYRYYVTQTQNNCESSIVPVNLHIDSLPEVYLGKDTILYDDESLILDATDDFISYEWNTGVNTSSITVNSDNYESGEFEFSVLVTDNNNCSNSDTLIITIQKASYIQNPNNVAQFKIYPNPTNGKFNIEFDNPNAEDFQLRILNLIGEEIIISDYSALQKNDNIEFDISSLPKGLYLIHIVNNSFYHIEKIMLQ